MFLYIVWIFLLNCLFLVRNEHNNCLSKSTCSECIQANPDCRWCSMFDFMNERCDKIENLLQKNCLPEFISNETTEFKFIQNEELGQKSYKSRNKINQIKPQIIDVKLRKKSSFKFNLNFKQKIDYPLDLYYLMDLSYTMKDDKRILASLADTLINQMQKITKDFKLGFGSFVDKTVMPFVFTTPELLKSPCQGCAAPYSFRNHMSLSNNTNLFAMQVKNSQISGNIDGPEGGLDAILQTIVCKEEIGWRPNVRKLLVYATDAIYHQAGDGKLAGIYKPNDKKCHLDENGYYNMSNYLDYPSINQIAQVVKEQNVNIIFAVTSNKIRVYKELSKLIEGSSVAVLKQDSSNVVDLIKEEHQKITSSVTLTDNSTDNYLISYKSTCHNEQLHKTKTCLNLRQEDKVKFEINVQLVNCLNSSIKKEVIKINPVGLNDELILNIETVCECACEQNSFLDQQQPLCSKGNGLLKCGICECLPGFYGKNCECKSDKEDDLYKIKLNKRCYRSSNDTQVCSGNGQCICNRCFCDEPFSGTHCECDPYNCERFNNLICGGLDHGVCNCGYCECNDQWTGSSCQCTKSNKNCLDPLTGVICNKKGDCICGKCECLKNINKNYDGKYCQKCNNCADKVCSELNYDIENQIFSKKIKIQNKKYTSYLIKDFHSFNETLNEALDENEFKDCDFIGNDTCIYTYKYKYDSNDELIIYSLENGKCSQKINTKKAIISIVTATTLSGIFSLILWKIITNWIDTNEFQLFEKQLQNTKWQCDENPLYKPSTSSFRNPNYNKAEEKQT